MTVLLAALSYAQDHPLEPCALQAGASGSPRLFAVKPLTALAWQCYASGKCSSYQAHAGDPLELDHRAHGWTCGYLTFHDGVGPAWIRSDDLSEVNADANPPFAAWTGT
ncbi:MAG TPA: hypothetical protein VKX25_09115 [Bryobacteraceae bacterium]|nr:hypothetical protein [Bryobacteraceae bacterium]